MKYMRLKYNLNYMIEFVSHWMN